MGKLHKDIAMLMVEKTEEDNSEMDVIKVTCMIVN